MELLSERNISSNEEKDILEFLDSLTIVPLSESIEKQTITLRRNTNLKLPDCIVAATSIVLNAVLLTDDHHFLDLSWPNFRTQNIF